MGFSRERIASERVGRVSEGADGSVFPFGMPSPCVMTSPRCGTSGRVLRAHCSLKAAPARDVSWRKRWKEFWEVKARTGAGSVRPSLSLIGQAFHGGNGRGESRVLPCGR